MSKKPEALEVIAALRERIAKAPSWDSTRTMLVCDDAARCIEKLHAEIQRLRDELRRQHAEIERLKAERDEAVKAEREACAKMCERDDSMRWSGAAAAIRARGQEDKT